MWSEVGVRACATLLLRGRRVGEALDVLRALTVPAPTLHPFLSAFEFASRLPMAPTDASSPPPSRFSPEQMLEVLEAALFEPGAAEKALVLASDGLWDVLDPSDTVLDKILGRALLQPRLCPARQP